MNTRKYSRRTLLSSSAFACAAIIARPYVARAETKEVLIAEPVHGTGYLPLYIGMAKNLFDDVKVRIVTIETGSGHTNAVLSGQAFAFIGGPEHCAFAKVKGAELRCVVNCVDRGNVYFCAASDTQPSNQDWPSYVKGKTIATSAFGGTPNSITRYLLKKWGLDPTKDVTLVETANSAILPVVKNKQAQIGCSTEPFITQGIRSGAWGEPFINIPKELGPYAYSTFNIRLDSIQKTPDLVDGFVRGMMKSLKFVQENHDETAELAQKQFPTMAIDDLKATLARSFADEMWSKDGMVSRAAWDTAKSVVMTAGILKTDVGYDDIIDMSFVKKAAANL
ncbi:MAG TPA: ABC transporter substrate-binding protein [Xanthobacteraceae bacterium]|jgi:NitT/TauT family transport system substrate-binding protein|nr:ABC transporter substrate-binding protein [Xanthobacteraceae bacterium]